MQGITSARQRRNAVLFQQRREPRWLRGREGGRVLTKNIWPQLDKAELPPAGRGDGSPELRLRRPRNSECTRI